MRQNHSEIYSLAFSFVIVKKFDTSTAYQLPPDISMAMDNVLFQILPQMSRSSTFCQICWHCFTDFNWDFKRVHSLISVLEDLAKLVSLKKLSCCVKNYFAQFRKLELLVVLVRQASFLRKLGIF
jgi:hypothetical protein